MPGHVQIRTRGPIQNLHEGGLADGISYSSRSPGQASHETFSEMDVLLWDPCHSWFLPSGSDNEEQAGSPAVERCNFPTGVRASGQDHF